MLYLTWWSVFFKTNLPSNQKVPGMTRLPNWLSGRPGICDVTTIYTKSCVDATLEPSTEKISSLYRHFIMFAAVCTWINDSIQFIKIKIMLYFDDDRTADVQSQNAATAYFTYKQLLPFNFTPQNWHERDLDIIQDVTCDLTHAQSRPRDNHQVNWYRAYDRLTGDTFRLRWFLLNSGILAGS